jgi:hypothetical protein
MVFLVLWIEIMRQKVHKKLYVTSCTLKNVQTGTIYPVFGSYRNSA